MAFTDRQALEPLITRHQAWIYNIVLRMVYLPQDAEDATQEILVKLITKLSTFAAKSSFRTWLYRLVVNHVLNLQRRKSEAWDFARYKVALDAMPDKELPDPSARIEWSSDSPLPARRDIASCASCHDQGPRSNCVSASSLTTATTGDD